MVEVKTETSKEILPVLTTENKNTQPLPGLVGSTNWKLGYKETKTRTIFDTLRPMKDGRRLSTNTKVYSKIITQSKT